MNARVIICEACTEVPAVSAAPGYEPIRFDPDEVGVWYPSEAAFRDSLPF